MRSLCIRPRVSRRSDAKAPGWRGRKEIIVECFSIKKKKKDFWGFFRVREKVSEHKSYLQNKIYWSGAERETEGEKNSTFKAA